ncbi:MAG: matrixin family metalloprotease [Methanothrix sp.]
MTALRRMTHVLILSYTLITFINPVLGITVYHGTDGAFSSTVYNLDTSTSLKDVSTLGDGKISQVSQLSGSGVNEISYLTSAKGNRVNSAIKSSGVLSATTSTTASGEVAYLSQDVAGSGDLAAVVQGKSDSTSTEQMNAVLNGHTSSSLNAFAGKDISTSGQSTTLFGDAGATSSSANSAENNMAVKGGFSGSGDLNTELTTIAAERSGIYGTNSFNGQEVVNNNVLKGIASGELSVSADGIYADRDGDLGTYGVTATNILNPSQNKLTQDNGVFATAGWRWANNVAVQYQLSTNLIGRSTSANAKLWAREISKGANEWDRNTAKNVFKGSDTTYTAGSANVVTFTSKVPVVGTYQGGTGDGKNNYIEVTKAVTGSTIAVTWTWYYNDIYVTGADGNKYNKAAESDIYFNGNLNWRVATSESTATNSKFDIRTIATHEVGHTLGLADLYGSGDTSKTMYGYNNGQVDWYLSNADKLGLRSLYGR